MIFDSLDRLPDYARLMPALRQVDEILRGRDLPTMPGGRHPVDDNLYFNIDDYRTVETPPPFEVHRRYADVQIVLAGREKQQIAERRLALELPDFDVGRDIAFFPGDAVAEFRAAPGRFLIWFPGEPHRSQMSDGAVCAVRKAVFKVLVARGDVS